MTNVERPRLRKSLIEIIEIEQTNQCLKSDTSLFDIQRSAFDIFELNVEHRISNVEGRDYEKV